MTVVCADELGPVTPRPFPPAPGWSAGGHPSKGPLGHGRGPEKGWGCGGLRVRGGQAVTRAARSRTTAGSLQLRGAIATANPAGEVRVITDSLASHTSPPILAWLAESPRIEQVFIPAGACWRNRQEAWWRRFRRAALAGQSLANAADITPATTVATKQPNKRAKPRVRGRPPTPHRHLRRLLAYRI